MPRSKTKARAKKVAFEAESKEKEEKEQEQPKRLTEEQKKIMAQASLTDMLTAAAEWAVKQEAALISKSPEFKEKAVQALHESAANPVQFERKAKAVFKEQKEMAKTVGNGLPLDCRVFVFDYEMFHLQQDRGGFVDSRIFQKAFVPLFPREKKSEHVDDDGNETLFVNVNPGIKWPEVHKQFHRYIKNAWNCRSIEECAKRANEFPTFPAAFDKFIKYLVTNTPGKSGSDKNVLLIGFNSMASDLLGLQAEMNRHALRWPTDIGSVWLWDCASFLRSKAQLQSDKWSLGLLYNSLTGKHMPNAHHARDDAEHLRELLRLTLPGDDSLVCELASKQAFGVAMIGSAEHDVKRATRRTDKAFMEAQKMLTPAQLEALEFGEKKIKEGQVKGLGRLHAARLRLHHNASLFHHLFDLYKDNDDEGFLHEVVRKGITKGTNNMAKEAEQKLLRLAKDYAVPRDIMRRRLEEQKEKEEAERKKQAQAQQTRLQFLEQLEKRTITEQEKLHQSVGRLKEIQTRQQRASLFAAFDLMLPKAASAV